MKDTCKVVIVDDHHLLRDLLRAELQRQTSGHYVTVGEAGTGGEAIEVCLRTQPEMVVYDLLLPGSPSGLEALRELRVTMPHLPILIFSGCTQRTVISQATALDVRGFVRKAQPLQTLLSAMRKIENGETYFDRELTRLGAEPSQSLRLGNSLTVREREVARLIAEGMTTKEAALEMGLSIKTVDKHRSRMMKKLQLHDAVSVTRYAIQTGLVSLA